MTLLKLESVRPVEFMTTISYLTPFAHPANSASVVSESAVNDLDRNLQTG